MEHVTTNEQRIDPRQIRYPQPPPEVASTLVTTSTTTTYTTPSSTTPSGTTPSGTTPSGFFSEARTSVTSLGTVGRKTMLEMSVRSKLSRIKRVIRQRPHIFLDSQGTKQIQEVDYIYNELQDCSSLHASPDTNRRAARLILEIAVLTSGPGNIILVHDRNVDNRTHMWLELITQTSVHSLLSLRPVTYLDPLG